MILLDLPATMYCDFEGCTNTVKGKLVVTNFGPLCVALKGDSPLPSDRNWALRISPEEGIKSYCHLHHTHARQPALQVVKDVPKDIKIFH